MESVKKEIIEAGEAEIERQQGAIKSRQPRFQVDPDKFFASVFNWIVPKEFEIPIYQAESRVRDEWLRTFWPLEPHLAGILNSTVLIDANRGWNLVGGRNQVSRYIKIFHNLEDGEGWRHYCRLGALSFRTADIGFISEIGREGRPAPDREPPPMRSMWYVDPARCELTGNYSQPLDYYPATGEPQSWGPMDYFRVASMYSTDEKMYKLGFCAVSRAIEIAKTMIAIYQHDHEQLGARAPRGLLLLQNITENQWDDAMVARKARLDSLEHQYYGALAVLATEGLDQVDAKLIALSQLPKDFNRREFTDLLMFAYALVFGYSPDEFWPVRSGSIGRGRETEIQHRKATSKGVLDFPASMQEQIQRIIPQTLEWGFEERDVEGEQLDAEVALAKVKVIQAMYEAGTQGVLAEGALISRDEARSLLVESGLIPEDWTAPEEDVVANDEEAAERIRASERIQRAARRYPDEPIVRYRWPRSTMEILWERGDEMMQRRTWTVRKPRKGGFVLRQDNPDVPDEVLYLSDDVEIRQSDVDRAIDEAGRRVSPEFQQALSNEPLTEEELAAIEPARSRRPILERLWRPRKS